MSEKPSFSRRRKWTIGFQVCLIILVMLSIVVTVNYLSSAYFHRFHWSSFAKNQLSPQTVRFVQSLTNQVKVTVYYDRDEPFFTTVQSLLKEYRYLNPRITIETVDYLRDAVAAQRIKAQYKLIFPTATNLVIFESVGKQPYGVDGNALTAYTLEQVPNEKERVFQRRAVAFQGERQFTAALLAVTSAASLKAYFLEGHGEHPIMGTDTNMGYSTFAAIAEQNYIKPIELHSLLGNNIIPPDCNLLVIAGPSRPLQDVELEKIERYLTQGGRLLALFNSFSAEKETGLERLLRKWGVEVSDRVIKDPSQSTNPERRIDVITRSFKPHPSINPLLVRNWSLHFYDPRSVGRPANKESSADTLKVEEIVFSSSDAYAEGDNERKREFPLMVAVEKGDTKGIIAGSTRMIVAGDSIFLGNQLIESGANKDFAGFALNWLLDRTQLLEGVGSRSVVRHQLLIPATQLTKAEWFLLGGMPGAALALGGVVWLRRRK